MTTTLYRNKSEPQTQQKSYVTYFAAILASITGTYINSVIAIDWFSFNMPYAMAFLMGICLTALEFSAAHFLFNKVSGILGRAMSFIILSLCIASFLLFGALPVLVNQTQKTQVDVTTTSDYQSSNIIIGVIKEKLIQAADNRRDIKNALTQCNARYPIGRWKNENKKCSAPLDESLKLSAIEISGLQDSRIAQIKQRAALVASSPKTTPDAARSQAMLIIYNFVTFSDEKTTHKIGSMELAVALFRAAIAEISILFGAWVTNRFKRSNPLYLFVQLLHISRTSKNQCGLSFGQKRLFSTKNSTSFRLDSYVDLIQKGQIDDFSSSLAARLNIRNSSWNTAMIRMVIGGYLMPISHRKSKQLNYRRPLKLDGAIEEGKGRKMVLRLPPELRIDHQSAVDFEDNNIVNIARKRA